MSCFRCTCIREPDPAPAVLCPFPLAHLAVSGRLLLVLRHAFAGTILGSLVACLVRPTLYPPPKVPQTPNIPKMAQKRRKTGQNWRKFRKILLFLVNFGAFLSDFWESRILKITYKGPPFGPNFHVFLRRGGGGSGQNPRGGGVIPPLSPCPPPLWCSMIIAKFMVFVLSVLSISIALPSLINILTGKPAHPDNVVSNALSHSVGCSTGTIIISYSQRLITKLLL